MGCIASDPIEDTERGVLPRLRSLPVGVASPPIRLRILKEYRAGRVQAGVRCCIASDPIEDTESPNVIQDFQNPFKRCIASDPIEDTERQ